MKKMKCIAIDDEPLALEVIRKFCERQGDLSIETYDNPAEGMERIMESSPDIVFLDVEMNETSGLILAKQLPERCNLIFTTAHAQYALDGFNLDAADFLHKPFSYDRFLQAVSKAGKIGDAESKEVLNQNISLISEYRNISIKLDEISYIEALGNYCKVCISDGNFTLAHTNMKAILQLLPEDYFCRIHRSFIVSLKEVESFTKSYIRMKNCDKELPIGNQFAKEFTDKIRR